MRPLLPAVLLLLMLPHVSLAEDLMVVTPRVLAPSLSEFVAYKNSKITTKLEMLEDILAKSEGSDDGEKLKRYLHEKWRAGKVSHILLAGDADVLPVRYMTLDRVTSAAFDYSFYPSDLYYADLAKKEGSYEDWNAGKDGFHSGYFGEVRGEKNKEGPINFDQVDYLPEIAVGRWPVSTPEQARAMAAKSMAGEKQRLARRPEKRRAALIATTGWVDTKSHFDALESVLRPNWSTERRLFGKETKDRANETGLLTLWNGGQDLVLHAGHGQPGDWDQCLSSRSLGRLTNVERLPVVFSAGCSTGYFAALAPYDGYTDTQGLEHKGTDHGEVFQSPPPPPANYQRGAHNKTGLGEELLRMKEGGAIAYIGCNTGSQPCALTLQLEFVKAMETKNVRLGDAWNQALRHYFEHEHLAELKPTSGWYPPSIFFQGMKFMVFGDPTLEL